MTSTEVQPRRYSGGRLLGDLEAQGALTATGLTLPPTLTFGRFTALLTLLGETHESMGWWLGDAMLFGEALFGEESYQAFEALPMSEASRLQYVRVASRIPKARRREALSWSHHRSVVALEEADQDSWLLRAETEGWTKADLESHLRDGKPAKAETQVSSGYIVERVASAAEELFAVRSPAPGGFFFPSEAVSRLADALGAEL